jgi:hypothetical protein
VARALPRVQHYRPTAARDQRAKCVGDQGNLKALRSCQPRGQNERTDRTLAVDIPLSDPSLFGNDAGEDEAETVLMSYFVDQAAFAGFLDLRQRFFVARGRKGTGKSALLARFAHKARSDDAQARPLIVTAVPSRLVSVKEPPETDNAIFLENYWKQVICALVNMELAHEIDFAWTDDQMAIVETAEIAGFRGRNIVSALLTRLASKVKIGPIEVAPIARSAPNHEQLLRRIDQERLTPRSVWFLLDDLDTNFKNTPQQQSFIASFFSAARYLTNDIEGLGIRVSVRSNVWTSLATAESLDKAKQYVADISWSATDQRRVLCSRILGYVRRNWPGSEIAGSWTAERDSDALMGLVFDERMRWAGDGMVKADHVVRVLAAGRPRWIAQLCRMAGARASAQGKARIGSDQIRQVMGEFGRERLFDLYREHNHQFSDLKRLVETFSNGAKSYSTPQLTERIERRYVEVAGAAKVPPVDGAPYRDPLQLAHFLYQCGFINGRNAGRPTIELPEYVTYEMRPDLLEVDTNVDSGMSWELLPAYRNILQVGQAK